MNSDIIVASLVSITSRSLLSKRRISSKKVAFFSSDSLDLGALFTFSFGLLGSSVEIEVLSLSFLFLFVPLIW